MNPPVFVRSSKAMGCPSLSSAGPWQAFYYGRKPPETGFKWTYGTPTGSEQTIACFAEMFDQIPNNTVVGMLSSNDADAAGWTADNAAPAVLKALGYRLVVPSWYTPGAGDRPREYKWSPNSVLRRQKPESDHQGEGPRRHGPHLEEAGMRLMT